MDSTDSDAAARPPKRPLKSSISLNLKDHIGEGLGLSGAQRPLSPNNYQFLLRRASAVIEEQMEVSYLVTGRVCSACSLCMCKFMVLWCEVDFKFLHF